MKVKYLTTHLSRALFNCIVVPNYFCLLCGSCLCLLYYIIDPEFLYYFCRLFFALQGSPYMHACSNCGIKSKLKNYLFHGRINEDGTFDSLETNCPKIINVARSRHRVIRHCTEQKLKIMINHKKKKTKL